MLRVLRSRHQRLAVFRIVVLRVVRHAASVLSQNFHEEGLPGLQAVQLVGGLGTRQVDGAPLVLDVDAVADDGRSAVVRSVPLKFHLQKQKQKRKQKEQSGTEMNRDERN